MADRDTGFGIRCRTRCRNVPPERDWLLGLSPMLDSPADGARRVNAAQIPLPDMHREARIYPHVTAFSAHPRLLEAGLIVFERTSALREQGLEMFEGLQQRKLVSAPWRRLRAA